MKTEQGEHLKPRSQYVDDAVKAAIDGRWEDALEINNLILERFGDEEEASNRVGKALTELGRYNDAKAACFNARYFRIVLARSPNLPDGHPAGIITALYYPNQPDQYP